MFLISISDSQKYCLIIALIFLVRLDASCEWHICICKIQTLEYLSTPVKNRPRFPGNLCRGNGFRILCHSILLTNIRGSCKRFIDCPIPRVLRPCDTLASFWNHNFFSYRRSWRWSCREKITGFFLKRSEIYHSYKGYYLWSGLKRYRKSGWKFTEFLTRITNRLYGIANISSPNISLIVYPQREQLNKTIHLVSTSFYLTLWKIR